MTLDDAKSLTKKEISELYNLAYNGTAKQFILKLLTLIERAAVRGSKAKQGEEEE